MPTFREQASMDSTDQAIEAAKKKGTKSSPLEGKGLGPNQGAEKDYIPQDMKDEENRTKDKFTFKKDSDVQNDELEDKLHGGDAPKDSEGSIIENMEPTTDSELIADFEKSYSMDLSELKKLDIPKLAEVKAFIEKVLPLASDVEMLKKSIDKPGRIAPKGPDEKATSETVLSQYEDDIDRYKKNYKIDVGDLTASQMKAVVTLVERLLDNKSNYAASKEGKKSQAA
jgi:hypothetical protein